VYLVPVRRAARLQKPAGAGIKREIRQVGRDFVPHVLVVPVGAEVAFPNYASEEHNVFSPTDPPFDLGRYSTDKRGKTHRFEDTDEFDIFCDIHREMWAKVKVVDSAFIVKVTDGKFTFTDVPAGSYKVVAWTPNSAESKSEKLTVTDGSAVALSAPLHLQVTLKTGCHDRQDGTPYDVKYGRSTQCPGQR
jgi:plastocyanin